MEYILYVIETGLLAYFAFSALYTLSMAIMSHMDQPMPPTKWSKPRNRICVLIPAYKEDSVIYDTARSAAYNQSYPSNLYEVIVIADQLKPSTIRKLGELPIRVIPVSFEKSTKVKALNAALDQLDDIYECAVILDADNVMEFTFLEKVSTLYDSSNHKVIQGQRKPKNSQTTLAFLDGVSESINTSIFRRGTSATGLSSAISGSGFAAEFGLLRQELSAMDSIGGFDRELELRFIKKGFNVHYQHDLVVYDEKVSTTSSFENQRKRWISSQYVYLSKYFKEGMLSLLKGDISFFNSAILRNIQLPRLLNIGFLAFSVFIMLVLDQYTFSDASSWVLLYLVYIIATFIAIPTAYYSSRLLYSILSLPAIFMKMLKAFLGMKSANKKFIHTPHEA